MIQVVRTFRSAVKISRGVIPRSEVREDARTARNLDYSRGLPGGSVMRRRGISRSIATVLSLVALLAIPHLISGQAQPTVAALPPVWVLPPPAQVPATQTVAVRAGRMFDP